jgi:hypothetical protein
MIRTWRAPSFVGEFDSPEVRQRGTKPNGSICVFITARDHVRAGIRKYNESHGNYTGYHDTVTVAFLRIIAAKRRGGETFAAFKHRNPDVFSKDRPILLNDYSPLQLESDAARAEFLEPDVAPLPSQNPNVRQAQGGITL